MKRTWRFEFRKMCSDIICVRKRILNWPLNSACNVLTKLSASQCPILLFMFSRGIWTQDHDVQQTSRKFSGNLTSVAGVQFILIMNLLMGRYFVLLTGISFEGTLNSQILYLLLYSQGTLYSKRWTEWGHGIELNKIFSGHMGELATKMICCRLYDCLSKHR